MARRPPDPAAFDRFLADPVAAPALAALFGELPDVYAWAKDRDGRFVYCNPAFAALLGCRTPAEIMGLRDADFFPPDLAESYSRDDVQVLASGEPLREKIELIRNPDGSIDWYSTTKLPVRDVSGEVVVVVGLTRDIKKLSTSSARFLSMAPAVESILSDYAQPLSIPDLAAKVNLSVSQFERQFKRKFGTTPLRYIAQIRLNAACQLLAQTDLPISDIAQQTGFYDQSHFTHQFVRWKGMTPSRYRAQFEGGSAAPVPR